MSRAKILFSLLLIFSLPAAGFAGAVHQGPAANPPAGKQSSIAEKSTQKPIARTDLHGDPLPAGAVARLGSNRWHVSAEVEVLAFAPDGKTVACANRDGVFLFDRDGRLVKEIRSAKTSYYRSAFSPYHRLAFSPDGRRLACWSMVGPAVEKQVMLVWFALGQRIRLPLVRESAEPVGKRVVQIWDLPAGHTVKEYDAEDLLWLGWSADGEPLAVNLVKGALLFRELATGKKHRLAGGDFPPKLMAYYACAYASQAKVLGIVDSRGVIHVWDISTGKERFALKANRPYVPSLALTADGRSLAALTQGDADKDRVEFWDLTTGKTTRTVEFPFDDSPIPRYLDTIAFSPNGKTLAVDARRGIGFYDVATGSVRSDRRLKPASARSGVAFSPDGKTLAVPEGKPPVRTDNSGTTIQLWDVATASMKPAIVGHTGVPDNIVFSPDGRRVVTVQPMYQIHWDPATGKPFLPAPRRVQGRACAFSADGRVFLSFKSNMQALEYSDTDTGRTLNRLRLPLPNTGVRGTASPHDVRLSNDRTILVDIKYSFPQPGNLFKTNLHISGWDVETRKELFSRQRDSVAARVVSADLKTLAFLPMVAGERPRLMKTGLNSGPVHLEDLATGEHLLDLPEVKGETVLVNFSPDGRFLVTGTASSPPKGPAGNRPGAISGTLRLWELASASEALTISAGFQGAFSTNGRLLALPDPAREIVLWDLWRGKERQRFKDFNADVTCLTFSPDGKRLVSGLSDTTLLVWQVAAEPNAAKSAGLDAAGAERAWADLAGDARKAFAARGTLALSPEAALPVLKKQLKPVQDADPALIRRLLVDLDGDNFAAREKARKELEELGDRASTGLQEALKNKPSLEAQRRIEALLKRLKSPVTDLKTLQSLRAIAILEDIGTSEARKILESLAKVPAEARRTREAKTTLERMGRRLARGS